MKVKREKAGVYNIIKNGEIIGEITDGRKFGLNATSGRHWRVTYYQGHTDNPAQKKSFYKLKDAKKAIKND